MVLPPARDRILEAARRLFQSDGFRATGIDKIIAESGVAKMTLYRHFASKADLIAAYLDWRHECWMTWFTGALEARMAQLEERRELAAVADVLGEWFAESDFRGCAFINSAAETGLSDDPRHLQRAAAHKQDLENYIAAVAERLGLRTPREAAAEAMLCVEGMIVRYQMTGDATVVEHGRRLLGRVERAYANGARQGQG